MTKNKKRPLGNVRQLPSGRFQARYRPSRGNHITAPHTFTTEAEARAWLAATGASIQKTRARAKDSAKDSAQDSAVSTDAPTEPLLVVTDGE